MDSFDPSVGKEEHLFYAKKFVMGQECFECQMDSLPPTPELTLVLPFLCSNDSEADNESKPAELRPKRHESLAVHDAMVSRWRDRAASRSSSLSISPYDTFAPSSKFPLALVVTPSEIHQQPVILIRPREAITFGRPYHTHPSGSLTTLVSSSTLVLRLIAPSHVDLLPPHKRFRDSYSLEDSRVEHMEIYTADAEVVVDLGISDGVGEVFEPKVSTRGTMEIVADPLVTGSISGSTRGDAPDLEGTLYDIVHYMSQEEFCQIHRDRDDAQRRLRRFVSFIERRLGFRH
nr:hypothetical protein [Tanacetum cinerariifolium]